MARSIYRHTDATIQKVLHMYFALNMSMPEISKSIGLACGTLRALVIRSGNTPRSHSEAGKIAGWKITSKLKGRARGPMSESTKKKLSEAHFGKGAGTSIKPNGYIEFTSGEHKHRGVHRVKMEMLVGRPLEFNEVVHHKDGNKQNNNPSNLEVMTRSDHTRLHRIMKCRTITK